MSKRHLIAASAVLAFTLACQSDGTLLPPEGFSYAAATRTCGPADGPAIAIYLAPNPVGAMEPATPYVRVNVWQSVGDVAGGSWDVGSGATDAAAARFTAPTDFEVATQGRVTVSAVGSDTTVRGTVDLTFPSIGRITGAFEAAWISLSPLCG